ncbi:MAG: TerC family protein [Candidatus Bostrichicola ureolyticus]|nr:MAG: TerC family protein [Candidatus Bostrichicola ureolyticus]
MDFFFNLKTYIVLLMLIFLEIVLGIDNLLFLSIISNKLPPKLQNLSRIIGLSFAMFIRLILLLLITLIFNLKQTLISFNISWIKGEFSYKNLILLLGGFFLLYKSVNEIYYKLKGKNNFINYKISNLTLFKTIVQIILIDIVFSLDSILTSIGIVSFKPYPQGFGYKNGIILIMLGIIITMTLMLSFSNYISNIINNHPTLQILVLSFLLLIGLMLITEAAKIGNFIIFNNSIKTIPKNVLYITITFALLVEMINLNIRRNQ